MGVETNFFVGAYAVIKAKGKIETITKKKCPKCNRDIKRKGELFCSSCGSRAEDYPVDQETIYPNLYDLIEKDEDKYDDVLFQTNVEDQDDEIIVIGNSSVDNSGPKTNSEYETEIKKEDPDKYVANFKNHYAEILDFLSNHPDVESLKVTFGTILYYS